MKKILLFVITTFCLLNPLAIGEETTSTFVLTKDDVNNVNADDLKLLFKIGGARVNISQVDDNDTIVKAVVTFDNDNAVPTFTTSESGSTFTAEFVSGNDIKRFDKFNRFDISGSIERWEITIGNYDIDTNLTMNTGGATGNIDFGGMPIKDCMLNLGGANLSIDFSSPTSRQVDDFMINGGGIKISISNIGNTDFKRFNLLGGGNNVELDFRGSYESEQHDVAVTSAGGLMNIVVPSDSGEKLNAFSVGTLLTVNGNGWERTFNSFTSKNYITDDYSDQETKIDINLTGVGSIISVGRE